MSSIVGLTEILNVTVTPAPGSVQDENLKQVAGNPVDTGTGAAGAGTQRVALSTDSQVSVSNFPATQAVTGTVGVNNFPATQTVAGAVTANAGTGTFAVSAASLPLPTGAATSANQTTLGQQTTKINDGTNTAAVTGSNALKVDGSAVTQPVSGSVSVSNFPATQPVSGSVSVSNFPATQTVSGTVGVSSLPSIPTGANTIGSVKLTDGTNTATLGNLTNSKPLATMIVDGAGTQITSFGGGTQYSQGTTQSSPTGTVAMAKSPSNVLNALNTDASGNLNVNLAAGSISGGNAAAGLTGTTVPTSAGYTGFNSGGNLVGVSASNPLPVTASSESLTPITGSLSANGTLLSTDTAGYNSISVQITGVWEATITFMASNDNTNWVNVQGYAFNSTMNAIDVVEDNDIYILPVVGRYFKVDVSAYLSGTVVATAYLRSQSLAGIGEASLTQAMDQTTGTPINIGFKGFQGPGSQPSAYSLPVAIASDQFNDLSGTGATMHAGQIIALNANLMNQSLNDPRWFDCQGYRAISFQIVGVSTSIPSAITLQFETSNDGSTFQFCPLNDLYWQYISPTSTTASTYQASFPVGTTSGTVTTGVNFIGNLTGRYFRLRATSGGGSLNAGSCRITYRLYTNPISVPGTGMIAAISGAPTMSVSYVNGQTISNNGTAVLTTLQGVPISGFSNPYTRTVVASTTLTRNVTDATGAQTVAGVTAVESESYATRPLTVRQERATASTDAMYELLQQMLVELKALSYYTRELPMAISSMSQTPNPSVFGMPLGMADDPENFYNDPTIFQYVKGN